MIYRITESDFNAINAEMPDSLEFGYSGDDGLFYYDDAIFPHIPFDLNITLMESVGKNYSDYVSSLSPITDFYCKIYRYFEEDDLKDLDRTKPPLGHDYKTGLNVRLHPKRTTIKGEVVKVDYYADPGLTDIILVVEIEYVRDSLGFALSRTTNRRWALENGSFHETEKVTTKSYSVNAEDQIKEGIRRRQNIIDTLQPAVLKFMFESLLPQGLSQMQIVLMGRAFIDSHELEFDKFVKSSSTVTDPASPNFGKKTLVVEFENATETWLDNTPASLGGISIRDFIIQEASI